MSSVLVVGSGLADASASCWTPASTCRWSRPAPPGAGSYGPTAFLAGSLAPYSDITMDQTVRQGLNAEAGLLRVIAGQGEV